MKITKKILENIIKEEIKKVLQELEANKSMKVLVRDKTRKQSRPGMDKNQMRSATMKELEAEYLEYGCQDVGMTSSAEAINFCEAIQAHYNKKAKAKGMSVVDLYDKHTAPDLKGQR